MKTRKMMVVGAALLASAGMASAQVYDTPPPPAAPRPLTIDAPSEQALPNGMRVIVARREGVPLVSAVLVVLSGSERDPPQRAGLASLTAGLLTQGTRKHSAPQIAAAAEALGGSLDSAAAWNQSLVSITVTTPRLGAALGLMAEVAREPTFAQPEIDRLRTQTLDGLKVAYADPGAVAGLTAVHLAYGDGPWGHPASGTPASLPLITRADLVAQHRATFRPDRAVLVLAGDITPVAAMALARSHFGSWSPSTDTPPLPTPPTPSLAPTGSPLAVIDMPAAGQAGIVVAVPLPTRRGADVAASDVLNAVLGSGYSSRLSQEIRIKRGLSYSVDSRIEARSDAGLFQAALQTKNPSTAEALRLLQGELDRVMQAPVPDDELAARKLALIGGFSRAVETTSGLANSIRSLVASGRAPAELKTRIASIEAVKASDVQRYAAANLAPGARRIAVAGVAAEFATALKAAVPTMSVTGIDRLELERPGGPKRN